MNLAESDPSWELRAPPARTQPCALMLGSCPHAGMAPLRAQKGPRHSCTGPGVRGAGGMSWFKSSLPSCEASARPPGGSGRASQRPRQLQCPGLHCGREVQPAHPGRTRTCCVPLPASPPNGQRMVSSRRLRLCRATHPCPPPTAERGHFAKSRATLGNRGWPANDVGGRDQGLPVWVRKEGTHSGTRSAWIGRASRRPGAP